jgi:thymidylate synthase
MEKINVKNNTLDKQYQNLLQSILDYGVEKKDRTGTGTKSIFGYTIRHKMSDGFPLLTTKKMAWKTMVTELLWFLRGDTNIKYLVDNNCHIWDGDCYKAYIKRYNKGEYVGKTKLLENSKKNRTLTEPFTQEEFINEIKTDDEFAKKWGDLGPIYGKQWRKWSKKKMYLSTDGSYENIYDETDQTVIDQISILINDLKTNPDSRRLMVSAWNVGELDQMVLPPCHYGFQVYTRELSLEERVNTFNSKMKNEGIRTQIATVGVDESYWRKSLEETKHDIPTRAISLMWNQRSCDVPLGIPMNIASYGLLLMMIADEVNMIPEELIGNLGDCHIYLNQMDGVKEQIGREFSYEERLELIKDNKDFLVKLSSYSSNEDVMKLCDEFLVPRRTREPFELPTAHVRDGIHCSSVNDVILENYQSHPKIYFPLSN